MADIESLATHGGIHERVAGYHRSLSRRFPYTIYYRTDDGAVTVVAVLDAKARVLLGYATDSAGESIRFRNLVTFGAGAEFPLTGSTSGRRGSADRAPTRWPPSGRARLVVLHKSSAIPRSGSVS